MADKKYIYRILDVNFNRAKEGLRVCEEVVRFALNDKKLTIYLRQLRYQISSTVNKLPVSYSALLSSRSSKDDVGKNFYPQRQGKKIDYQNILLVNLQRTKEALRVLEEFSAFIDKRSSRKFQNLRFKVYNLEKILFERL